MLISPHYFNGFCRTTRSDKGTPGHAYGHIYAPIINDLNTRGTPRIFEIGVGAGGSIKVLEFFIPRAQILCLDVDPATLALESAQTTIVEGNQSNSELLLKLREQYGPFDLIIDDGGHSAHQQMGSFHVLWPYVDDGGYYVIEDLDQSLQAKRPTAAYFAEMAFNLASEPIGRHPHILHFGGQIVALQKGPTLQPPADAPKFPIPSDTETL